MQNTDDSGKRTTLPVCIYRNLERPGIAMEKSSSPVSSIGSIFGREQACKGSDKFICFRRHEPFFKTIQCTELSRQFLRKGDDRHTIYQRLFSEWQAQKKAFYFFHKIISCRRTAVVRIPVCVTNCIPERIPAILVIGHVQSCINGIRSNVIRSSESVAQSVRNTAIFHSPDSGCRKMLFIFSSMFL